MPKTRFIRVKDPATRHEFDVPERDWRIKKGLLVPIKADRYPPADRPRAAKPFVELAPVAVPPSEPVVADAEDLDESLAESTPERPGRPPSRSRSDKEPGQ